MNYKDKKYLSEDRWLAENLDSFNFFFVAQLKACDSADWTNLQRDLSKLNLKTRSISFKNIKNLSFFSTLYSKRLYTPFYGRSQMSPSFERTPISTISDDKKYAY